MQKKGELTTQQIILLIIILVSFVVLLIFIFRLNPGETSSKQVCHDSVVLSSKGAGLVGRLDCKTNYLCVSGGDNCKEFTATSISNIDVSKQEAKNEIMKSLADEMSDCWWMFGEGKVDYMDSSFTGGEICAICSIVKFDEKIRDKIKIISYQEFYDYLRKTQKTQSQSHLQYLYSVNDLNPIQQEFVVKNYLNNNIDTSKEYFIITGISKKPVFRWIGLSGVNFIPVTILEKTTQNYNAIGCDEFVTKAS